MQKPPEKFFNVEDFVPGLRQIFERPPLDPGKIILAAVPVRDPEERPLVPAGIRRSSLSFIDGKDFWFWETDSLRALFRGNKQPPVLGDFPEAYNDSFILLVMHALEISKFFGDRRDVEMEEIYSTLRRAQTAGAWDSSTITCGRRQRSSWARGL